MDFRLEMGVFAPWAEYGVGDCGGKWVNGGKRWGSDDGHPNIENFNNKKKYKIRP